MTSADTLPPSTVIHTLSPRPLSQNIMPATTVETYIPGDGLSLMVLPLYIMKTVLPGHMYPRPHPWRNTVTSVLYLGPLSRLLFLAKPTVSESHPSPPTVSKWSLLPGRQLLPCHFCPKTLLSLARGTYTETSPPGHTLTSIAVSLPRRWFIWFWGVGRVAGWIPVPTCARGFPTPTLANLTWSERWLK